MMDELPDVSFTLNGGIKMLDQITLLKEKAQGLMLGRAIYANPYLLAEIEQQLFATPLPNPLSILSAYRKYMSEQLAAGQHFKQLGKHLLGYFTGCRGARHFRRYLSTHMFRDDASLTILDDAISASRITDNFIAGATV